MRRVFFLKFSVCRGAVLENYSGRREFLIPPLLLFLPFFFVLFTFISFVCHKMHKILQPKFKLFEDKCSSNCLDSFTNENKLTKIDPKKIIFGHHIFPLNFTWKWCFRWNSVRKTYISIIFFWASKVNAAETLMYPVQKLAGKTYTTVTV